MIGYESRNLETGIDVTSGGENEMRRGESKKWNPTESGKANFLHRHEEGWPALPQQGQMGPLIIVVRHIGGGGSDTFGGMSYTGEIFRTSDIST